MNQTLKSRVWLALTVLTLFPLGFHFVLKSHAKSLFKLLDPYIDFFLFHDAKAIFVHLGFLAAALALALTRFPKTAFLKPQWESTAVKSIPFLFFIIAGLVALPVYQNTALTMDEYAAVFQAKIFAAGTWAGQIPPGLVSWVIHPFQGNYFLSANPSGQVMETYYPGYALLLSGFVKLGIGWLFNPMLGALLLWLVAKFSRKAFGVEETSLWAMGFMIAAPVFWMSSLSFYSMNCRLFFNLAFAYFLLAPTKKRVFAAGLCGGMAALAHNPFPHAVFALPWVISMVISKEGRRLLPYLALGYLPFALAGAIWVSALLRLQEEANGTRIIGIKGFTQYWDVRTALTPPPVKQWLTWFLWGITLCKILLWSGPGVIAFFGFGATQKHRACRLLLASLLCTFFAYNLAGNRLSQGFGWGHRYTYAAMASVWIIAAYWLTQQKTHPVIRRTAVFLILAGLFIDVPFRLLQARRFIAAQNRKVPCLSEHISHVCLLNREGTYYLSDRMQNDPFLRNKRVILLSQGKERDEAMMKKEFPEYEQIHWDGQNGIWRPRLASLR